MGRPVGGRRHLPLRPHRHPRPGLRDRHPAADGERVAPRRPRVLLHPHRHHRPLPAHAGPRRLLPHGLGRQRPAHRAPGAELLRRPLRPVAPLRPRLRGPGRAGRSRPVAISRPNFVELCTGLTVEDEKAFEELFRHLGLSVDWTHDLHHHRRAGPAHVAAGVPAPPAGEGLAYQAEAPTLWDVDFQTAVAQAELEDRERPGAYHRLRFRDPDGGPLDIDTTRPELLAACVALVAHPDDVRYQKLFGQTATTPLFDAARPDRGPPPGRPREGHGHGHGLHLRRRHRRHLVAGAAPAGPGHHRPRRPHPRRPPPGARRRRRSRTILTGMKINAGPDPHGRAAAGVGRPRRRAPAHHPPGQVLREGRPAAGDRHQPPVVHPHPRPPRRAAGAGPGAALAPALHAGPATSRGSTASTATGSSAASASSACPSRSGTRSWPTTASVDHDAPDRGRRGQPARRPVHRRAPPATPPTSATSPAASPATPTSWTRGPRRRSRPRSPPGGPTTPTCSPAPSPWTCAPRPTRSSARGCSPPSCGPTT